MQCFYNWLIFIVVFLAVNSTKGQDVIFLMNTDEIQAQQIELSEKYVHYQEYNSTSGTRHQLEKSNIFMIKYEDGRKISFNENQQRDYSPALEKNSYVASFPSAKTTNQRGHFISTSISLSLPVGDYKSTEISENSPDSIGAAKDGFLYAFDVGLMLDRNIGLSMGFGFFHHRMDNQFINSSFRANSAGNAINATTGKWKSNYVLIGPIVSFPSEKTMVDVKFRAGNVTTKEPGYKLTTDSSDVRIETYQNVPTTSKSLLINVGLSVRRKVSRNWGFTFNIDYLYHESQFDPSNAINNGQLIAIQPTSYTQKIATYNLGVGLHYCFL